MKYVSVDQMISIEKEADKKGYTYELMMEQAGKSLAQITSAKYHHLSDHHILGIIGAGNNGGDTLIALDYLRSDGWQCTAYIAQNRGNDDPLIKRSHVSGVNIIHISDDEDSKQLREAIRDSDIILDGLLGTGIHLPLRQNTANLLRVIKNELSSSSRKVFIVGVDCPSGIDSNTGETAPETIQADLTVTMAAVKQGLLNLPAFDYVGELVVGDIGLPEDLDTEKSIQRAVADLPTAKGLLPKRPTSAHKGTFGTAMVGAGSINYTGAAILAGEAAHRCGAGMVTLSVPAPLHANLAGFLPEATWVLLPHEMGVIAESAAKVLRENLGRVTALLLGPGFGLEETTKEFLHGFFTQDADKSMGFLQDSSGGISSHRRDLPPTVLDADGLKLLAEIPGWNNLIPENSILTPHPGEMSVLTGMETGIIQGDRVSIAEKYAQEWGHTIVLKGAFTVIAAPDERTMIIPIASPALARAGTGDVLAGIIVGLLAQGMEPFSAAWVGAWIHAKAGLHAADVLGSTAAVLAGNVLEAVIDILAMLSE